MSNAVFEILSAPNAIVDELKFTDMDGLKIREYGANDPFHLLYNTLSQDDTFHVIGIFEHLRTDLFLLTQLTPNDGIVNEEYARFKSRLFVRTKFSLIEACLSVFVKLIKKEEGWEQRIGSRKALKQFSPDVRGQLLDRTKHILRSFDQVYGLDCPLDLDGQGWKGFDIGVGIRKRVTHPTSLVGLSISEGEATQIANGWVWFTQQNSELLHAYCSK